MTEPADELRAAAEKIRRLVTGSPANNQPWRYAKGLPSDSVRTATGWEVAYGDAPGDLRYIAAMHPLVGTALADWLEHAARSYVAAVTAAAQVYRDDPDAANAFVVTGLGAQPHALAVARAINTGGQS